MMISEIEPEDNAEKKEEGNKEEGKKWSVKYQDADADLELISSDGWHFKVHSYRLQTVSPVFRSMISMASSASQRDPMTFTDDKIELGVIIRVFLDAIYIWKLEDVGDTHNANLNLYLIDFASKWECQPVLDMFERDIKIRLDGPDSGDLFDQFLFAIRMGRFELAGECLGHKDPMLWSRSTAVANQSDSDNLPRNYQSDDRMPLCEPKGVIGANVFDLLASDQSSFLSIPPKIVWALLHATRLAREDSSSERFETRLGAEFVKIMRTAYPLKPEDDETKKRGRDEV